MDLDVAGLGHETEADRQAPLAREEITKFHAAKIYDYCVGPAVWVTDRLPGRRKRLAVGDPAISATGASFISSIRRAVSTLEPFAHALPS